MTDLVAKAGYPSAPPIKMGRLCHIERGSMRVRALAAMSRNAYKIERCVEAVNLTQGPHVS
jgi:hypothetical protein